MSNYRLKSNLNASVQNGWQTEEPEKVQVSLYLFENQIALLDELRDGQSRSKVLRDLLETLEEQGRLRSEDGDDQ